MTDPMSGLSMSTLANNESEDIGVQVGDRLQAAFLRELLRMASQQSYTSLMEDLKIDLTEL